MESWENQELNQGNKGKSYLYMLVAFLLFIFAIDLLTVSMSQLNSSVANDLFLATKNPFVSLFIGLLMTALIQSSSTVTASVVAVVASGSMTLEQAVPLVMGANIGTTLTSTLVSFSYLMKKKAFKRALSAGILHDIFNIMTVVILLPLELYFKILSRLAVFFAPNPDFNGEVVFHKVFTRPLTEWINEVIEIPFLTTIIAVFLVFGAIKLLASSVYKAFVLDSFKDISHLIFKKTGMAFIYGLFFTAAVQTSTVTTSLIVPLVANKKVSLKKVFPFIVGANIGTTITAAIAAIYKSEAAIALAIVHFLFNTFGALIILSIPSVRSFAEKLALYMGTKSADSRLIGFAYILFAFFIIPFLLIYFNND